MIARRPRQAGETRPQPNEHAFSRHTSIDFPVVALGVSAGGLDTFGKLFAALPANCGMAFVLIQHLDPKHESLLVERLAGHTAMQVVEVADGMQVERDHVYLIPPATYLTIVAGTLRLSRPLQRHGARMPFDFFLRSLAEECGERAICAILSGTGTDGSLGAKAVKEKGGLVIVQDPEEAAFDGMPRSAIDGWAADLVLTVAKIPRALVRYSRQNYVKDGSNGLVASASGRAAFADIIDLLAADAPHDFSLYKQGTLQRRIERRMAMAGLGNSARYLQLLRENSAERELLAKDLLINVAHFFRTPAAFALLGRQIIPELVRQQTFDRPLRIWVPGCSSGEEVYSITMLFLEQIGAAKRNIKLQVFASDIDVDCVAFARNGVYPESIEADVAPRRLARFFTKEDRSYRVVRELRETVVFTDQNLLADAPYSSLDLVSCRNLFIYLSAEAQQKILSLFYCALRPGGVLFLGSSESVGASDRFEPISKEHRIYRRVSRSRPDEVEFPRARIDSLRPPAGLLPQQPVQRRYGFGELSRRALLEAYAPASVLINAKHEGLYYFGLVDRYLRIASGEDTRDVLAMAREGLRGKLKLAIRRAEEGPARITVTGAQVKREGRLVPVSITALPVEGGKEELLLVSFVDDPTPEFAAARSAETVADASRVVQLEQELEATREELQSATRELEIANEEQKAINEETTSVNADFQSTNEELETSKEELQSLNEELRTLNSQLQETVEQQRAASNDLQNIFNSTDVATLFLDAELNIRFFTPAAKSLFNIIATDFGRPLADLTRRFEDGDLLSDALAVLCSRAPVRREVKAHDGAWFIRGVLPYLSDGSGIEGVVITFAGISEMKAAEREIEAARAYLDNIIATIRQPLIVLDEQLRVISASSSFHRTFSVKPEELIGRHLLSAADHLDVPALHAFLDSIQARGSTTNDYEIDIELPSLGRRSLLMNARVLREDPSAKRKILVAIVDVTEAKREGRALQNAKLEAEKASIGKSRFLAAASHDLRQPLQTISLLQGMLEKRVHDPATLKLVHRLDETVSTMSSTLDKLLDINQLEAGIVRPAVVDFSITTLLDEMRAEFAYHVAANRLDWRVVSSSLTARSDPRLLEQIIRNLLSNAVKYTTDGKLLLGCRRSGNRLRIEVWDTGAGIPEMELQSIFEEFHQLDNPARQRSKGLGLGLAIVQRLADLLGHKIDVRSRLGAGSVFTIEVPLGRAAATAPPMLGHAEIPGDAPARGTILVVDDDPAVLEMLRLLLEDQGQRPIVAADGHQALGLVKGSAMPDLIIADYNLPNGITGLEIIARLQARVQRAIPAIILTGDISTESLRDIAGHSCVHLNKPVRAKDLTLLVQRLLAKPAATVPATVEQLPLHLGTRWSSTVFVVDDDRAVGEALGDLLQEHGYSVQIFTDAAVFLEAYRPGRDGCLLVDALMPGMSGVALIERLKSDGHNLPAIVITGSGAVPMAVQAMKAGAVDFIEKPVGHQDLLASIQRALDQKHDTAALSQLRETAATCVASLTSRQRQILDLVLAGHPSKNIAADLGISQRTVDNHRAAIMKKTGSRSLPALIRTAIAAA
jgi:two-component system, chemotaxis family, CheB/CheR fusion protein